MRKLIKSVSLSILLGVAFIGAAWAQTFNAAVGSASGGNFRPDFGAR